MQDMKKGEMPDINSGRIIGNRIKQRRRELGLSQEKLAEALDVSYQQIQRYENGTNLLNTDKLQVVADFLNIPVSYLFEERGVTAADAAGLYISSEEAKLLRLSKMIDKRDMQCILRIMKLAAKKG